jgi:N-acetylmuramoyl-L-alanine amidase
MIVAVVALATGLLAGSTPASAAPPSPGTRPAPAGAPAPVGWAGPSAPVVRLDGRPYVSTTDLARLLSATRLWRADTRKLVLGIREHRLTLTVDNPYVVVGVRTWRLEAPIRSLDGDVHAPLGLLRLLPPAEDGTTLVWDERAARVRRPVATGPGPTRVSVEAGLTRVHIPTARPGAWRWIDRSRAVLRVQVPGARGVEPDSVPAGAHVRAVVVESGGPEPVFALALAPGAEWVRVTADSAGRRVAVELSADALAGGFRPGERDPAGVRALRTIVIDPGHGGADAGVRADGLAEKDVMLALARQLAGELERRTGASVRLTRTADETLAQEQRATFANRERADLVLSLHADGFPGARARGATVWVPPATCLASEALPAWRDVAAHHAPASRALAGAIARTLDARGFGPARVRERMPIGLHGVNAPGAVLECAVLTSPADRARLEGAGLHDLARAIADAIAEWARP